MSDRFKPWEGGYISEAGVYIIRKQIRGKRYSVSTRCTTLKGAMEQLKRFEADPEAYDPRGATSKEPIYIDDTLIEKFIEASKDHGNSAEWQSRQRRYLKWWRGELKNLDLRKVKLQEHILTAMEGKKSRQRRIAVIKRLYSWLRVDLFLLSPAEDPTLGTLAVPQSDPTKRTIKNKAVPKENILKAEAKLKGHWKDAMFLQRHTGWHKSEVRRFAMDGIIEDHPTESGMKVLVIDAKIGNDLRTAVPEEVAVVAAKLRERASFSIRKYDSAVKAACLKAEVAVFTPGRMRHSFATHAINKGASIADVSQFLNHRSMSTTRRFYANFAVAKAVKGIL